MLGGAIVRSMDIAWGPTILANLLIWGGIIAALAYFARRRR
jgi:hypothetical protein